MRLLITLVVVAVGVALFAPLSEFPMPYPAVNHRVIDPPPEDAPTPPMPLEGVFAPNKMLRNATRLFEGEVMGAESVVVADNGTLVLLDQFAQVWVAAPSDGDRSSSYRLSPQPVAYLGNGRPLGAHFDREGNLIVCDSLKGLIMLDKDDPQRITLLSPAVSPDSPLDPGTIINYANDLDVGSDGRVWFSAAQDILPALNRDGYWDTFWSYMLGMYSGHNKGRLLVYDPATRKTHVIAKGFYFANGVALSQDESFALVVETVHRRVWRVWLQGPKAGTRDLFVDALPGFPDGISRSADGGFWLALVAPYNPKVKLLKYKAVRALLSWVPLTSYRTLFGVPNPMSLKPWGCAVKLSPDGQVVSTLQDPDGSKVAFVSAITEHGNRLWLGNIKLDYVSYIDL